MRRMGMSKRQRSSSIHCLCSHSTPSSCNHHLLTSKKRKKKSCFCFVSLQIYIKTCHLFHANFVLTYYRIFVFVCSAVGMPQIKTITINNPSPSQTLQLTSVSGDTPDFHPSFFQSKVSILTVLKSLFLDTEIDILFLYRW